jgi:hypothetical protein
VNSLLPPAAVPEDSTPSLLTDLSRRDFTRRSVEAFLAVSLIEHLCRGNLLAAEFKPVAVKWLNEVNGIGVDLKEGKMRDLAWQEKIEDLLQHSIELPELLKFIDFNQIEKGVEFPDNGARSLRFDYPEAEGIPKKLSFGQQIFAMKKGRSVVPHGHNNMATAFLVLKGNFHGRHYDRITDEKEHMIVKPTIDAKFGPGSTSSVSDVKDNVHWFKAEDEPAFIFNLHLLGVHPDSPKRTGRIYIDPNGEKIDGGLIRARLIDSKEAHELYG